MHTADSQEAEPPEWIIKTLPDRNHTRRRLPLHRFALKSLRFRVLALVAGFGLVTALLLASLNLPMPSRAAADLVLA